MIPCRFYKPVINQYIHVFTNYGGRAGLSRRFVVCYLNPAFSLSPPTVFVPSLSLPINSHPLASFLAYKMLRDRELCSDMTRPQGASGEIVRGQKVESCRSRSCKSKGRELLVKSCRARGEMMKYETVPFGHHNTAR